MRSLPNIIKSDQSGREYQMYEFRDNLEELEKIIEEARKLNPGIVGQYKTREELEMEEALNKSQEILDVARAESEKIRQEAYEKGYEKGLKEGKEDGYWQAYNENTQLLKEDRDSIMDEVEETINSVKVEKQALLDNYLEDLKNISIAIAEKVIQISLKTSGDIIKRMIVSATEKLKKTEWAKIYISKYDVDLMTEGDAQILNSLSYLSDNIKVIMMDREESGTCIIELPKEIIDISVNTQLENIKDILNNAQL